MDKAPGAASSDGASLDVLPALAALLSRLARPMKTPPRVMQLAELDDHLLRDVGASRSEVMTALSHRFSRDPGSEVRRIALRRR
jgi:uncharacterized protein YjiS (DUF1127 family)